MRHTHDSLISGAGDRLLGLLNDLLDLSKLEAGHADVDLHPLDLEPLLGETVADFEALLDSRQQRVLLLAGSCPHAAADAKRVGQILRNLLGNAIKFSPEGGVIDVLGEATAGGELHFAVRDRGPGIPPAEIDRIFEAFVQSSRTKDGSGGTGLGLAICRKILEAHMGRIGAENATGGGSCFHVYLPVRGFADTMPMADVPER